MNIQPVGGGPAVTGIGAKEAIHNPKESVPAEAVKPSDTVSLGNEADIQSVYRKDSSAQVRVRTESDLQAQLLRRMIEKMITEQYEAGNYFFQLLYGHKAVQIDPNIRRPNPELILAVQSGKADPKLLREVESLVGENGFYGAEQTSARIIDYAKALTGGEKARIDTVLNSVNLAFSNVRKTLGAELPDLTQRTYGAVLSGFEAWRGQSAPGGETP